MKKLSPFTSFPVVLILVYLAGIEDSRGQSDAPIAAAVDTAAMSSSALVSRGSTGWRYLDTGEAPADGWKSLDFDDSQWSSGTAPLGYGEDDIATEISFGDEPEEKYAAAYFRHQFDAPAVASTDGMTYAGRIRFDDGVILFLNGQEIYRMNMLPEGEPGPDDFSQGKVSSRSRWEGRYEKFFIAPDILVSGSNILAAQVHQSDAGSSDLILDFELATLSAEDARREAIPDLFTSSSGDVTEPIAGSEIYLDDLEVVRNIAVKGKRLLAERRTVPGRSLMRDMENNRQHSIATLPSANEKELSAVEIYKKCAPSIVIISPVSDSSDPNRPGEGWGTGFVIAENGVVVTNWHVIEAMKDADVVTATTFDGQVFPLSKVLAARKDEDLAVVQLDTQGQTLAALSLVAGAGVGEPVTIISHPRTNFFNLTHGYISRYFRSRNNGSRLVSVTADIAGGSSGAPILNRRGDVIGIVSMTESLSANPLQQQTTADDEEEGNTLPDLKSNDESDAPPNEDEDEDDNIDDAPERRRPRTQLIPSSHQMTMKYGAPSVSVLELLE